MSDILGTGFQVHDRDGCRPADASFMLVTVMAAATWWKGHRPPN